MDQLLRISKVFSCNFCQSKLAFETEETFASETSSRRDLCSKFKTLVSRYVPISLQTENFLCCDECFPDVQAFCDMYEGLELLELELLRILDKISTKIKCTHIKNRGDEIFDLHLMVEEKRKRKFPRVIVEKLKDGNLQPPYINSSTIKHEVVEEVDLNISNVPSPSPNIYLDETKSCENVNNFDGNIVQLKPEDTEAIPNVTREAKSIQECGWGKAFPVKPGASRTNLTVNSRGLLRVKVEGKIKYSCTFCPKIYTSDCHLETHLLRHISEKPYTCRACKKEFVSATNWSVHVTRVHGRHKKMDVCRICRKSFRGKEDLRRHMMCRHQGKILNYGSFGTFKCETCGREFKRRDSLTEHRIRSHTVDSPFHCDKCPRKFKIRHDLTNHKNRIHGVEGEEGKQFECDVCGKMFSTRLRAQSHKTNMHTSKTYKCTYAGCNSFHLKSEISKHIRWHTGERPYKCNLCDRSYTSRNGLNIHLESHKSIKRFPCNLCEKSFATLFKLKRHQRTHKANAK